MDIGGTGRRKEREVLQPGGGAANQGALARSFSGWLPMVTQRRVNELGQAWRLGRPSRDDGPGPATLNFSGIAIMKQSLRTAVLLTFLCPVCALAQSTFDGTWKIDMNKVQMPKKPDVVVLQDGTYQCKTCAPPISIKADGQDQKVEGHPYYDMVAMQVVDDHTVKETDKKGGKVVGTSTTTVASDGKTAHFEFTDSSNTNGAPVTGSGDLKLVAKGPAGSHAISGSWITANLASFSENGLLFTYKEQGGLLSMTTPTGQSYSAKTDGTEAPYKGDPGITSVTVKRTGKNSLIETDKRNGKVIAVITSTLSADGQSMTVVYDNELQERSMSYVAVKQ
jgi:hypothetical protein